MGDVTAALGIWRRAARRTFLTALIYWLPWLLFSALFIIAVGLDPADADHDRAVLGWLILTIPYAHVADQLLAVSVLRGVRAAALGVPPRTLRELGRLPSMLVCALGTGALLVATTFVVVVPALVLVPNVYVTTLVAGAERRGPLGALRRGQRLSRGFRWRILGVATALWAGRWALTAALIFGGGRAGALGLQLGVGAATLANVALGGLFAAAQVVFYQRMCAAHDDQAGALARVFD